MEWREWFDRVDIDMDHRPSTEEIYQAFKARFMEELGVKEPLQQITFDEFMKAWKSIYGENK